MVAPKPSSTFDEKRSQKRMDGSQIVVHCKFQRESPWRSRTILLPFRVYSERDLVQTHPVAPVCYLRPYTVEKLASRRRAGILLEIFAEPLKLIYDTRGRQA